MKKHKKWIIAVICILLATAWIWRYVSMNKYYDDLDNGEYKLYQMGEMVPFEDDSTGNGENLNGCYIQATGIQVRDCDALLKEKNLTLSSHYQKPEKLVLVTVTVKNETSEEKMLPLTGIGLHGVDTNVSMNNELLYGLNPQLNKNANITLSSSEVCSFVLPYDLYRSRFGGITWMNIKRYKFYLQVTSAMTQKEILLTS